MSFVWTEGTYSSYAIYDSIDFDAPPPYLGQTFVAIFNCQETVILILDRGDVMLLRYTIATKTLEDRTGIDITTLNITAINDGFSNSRFGTYAVINDDGSAIRIFKNGTLIQTLTYEDLGLDLGSISEIYMSYSGKYILVQGSKPESDPLVMMLVILVGS